MSEGGFIVPITTADGRVTGWGRGDHPVAHAAYHKETGTDVRFLRYVNDEITEITSAEKDAIYAHDEVMAQEAAAAKAAEAAQASARDALIAHANAAYQAEVQALRDAYAAATGQLCQIAGLPVVRVLTLAEIHDAVMPLLAGASAGTVNGLLTLLTNLEGKLCREDGADALDRV
jgi:hypothetical protein